jgi:hypothetical protein
MKIINKTILYIFLIFCIPLFTIKIQAQDIFGIGVNAGAGSLGGNLPSSASFNTSIFIEGNPGFDGNYLMRLTFVYVTDMNILLPNSLNNYYPFVKGISLKGIQFQDYANSIYSEEGLGILALNDRTYSTFNEWDYGAVFSALVGLDLRHGVEKGFRVGVGAEYGLTFTNTTVRYISIYLQSILFF